MKIGELIWKLEKIHKERGDLEVFISEDYLYNEEVKIKEVVYKSKGKSLFQDIYPDRVFISL